MRQYHELLQNILDMGNDRGDRTGTGTRSCFGLHFRHNLADGFPLLTTKKMPWKPIVVELLWFLRGDTNIKYLLDNNVHIWSADAFRMYKRQAPEGNQIQTVEDFEYACNNIAGFCKKWGDLGPIYSKQWRSWEAGYSGYSDVMLNAKPRMIDQIKNVIESIRKNPEGRRHIVTAWNPAEVDSMALPPCHCLYQFYVADGKLSCHLYQRSADVFLGVPFNIASYALLTHIIANQTGLEAGDLVISFGDIHIYNNHRDQVLEQLSREPKALPKLHINTLGAPIEDLQYGNFMLEGYESHPAIKGELSVGV